MANAKYLDPHAAENMELGDDSALGLQTLPLEYDAEVGSYDHIHRASLLNTSNLFDAFDHAFWRKLN